MTRRCLLLSLASLPVMALAQVPPTPGDTFSGLLKRGFALHQQADYREALPVLQQAWKLDPHDYFANLLLGIDTLRTGDAEKAVQFLTVAARLRPDEEFAYEYSGEAQTQRGRYDQAAIAYRKAAAVAPTSPEATEAWIDFTLLRFRQLAGQLRSSQTGLAAEYRLQARSYPAADKKRRDLLEQSVSIDPKASGIWSELALADLAGGDDDEAQRNVQRASAQDPNAAIAQAWIAATQGDWKQASRLLNRVAAQTPALLAENASVWPPSLQPTASVTGPAAKFLACVRSGPQACPIEPRSATANLPPAADAVWLQRGVHSAQSGRCEEAIPALERGLNSAAQPVYGQFLLSWCYAGVAGTLDAHLRHIGGDPAIAHMVRGDVLFRMQGDTAASMVEYQAALAARPGDPNLLERLAEAQLAGGDLDGAQQNAKSALSLDAHRYAARQTLAKIAMEQGRYAEALPQLTLLAEQDPHDAGTQISLATTLSSLEKASEALQHLEPVLAKGYPDPKGNLHSLLGSLLRKAGRPAEATQAFATARQLSENYQQSSHRDQDDPK